MRVYRTFKQTYMTEDYVKCPSISRQARSAFAKFRCGVPPLKIETGRYQSLDINQRTCFNCQTMIEDECHVLLHCPFYDNLRELLLFKANEVYNEFSSLAENDKLSFLLSNVNIVKHSAKTCNEILKLRRHYLYNK